MDDLEAIFENHGYTIYEPDDEPTVEIPIGELLRIIEKERLKIEKQSSPPPESK